MNLKKIATKVCASIIAFLKNQFSSLQQCETKPQLPDNQKMYSLPYDSQFTYCNNELQVIMENTVTEVVKHTQSTIFIAPTLCQVEYDASTNLLSFELVLRDDINYYDEQRGKKDIDRFNHHYQHLQVQHATQGKALYTQYYNLHSQYLNEMQNYGYSAVNLLNIEQLWIACNEYMKQWQYYVSFNLAFVSCSKASYDPTGRICVVRFKIC